MSKFLELQACEAFARIFGSKALFVAEAPGRVELLGNHTDYNGGLVIAAAIDRSTVVAGAPISGPERVARVYSVNLDRFETLHLDRLESGESGDWIKYVAGAVWAVQESFGPLPSGFDAVVLGDVPLGAGLSSSASVQVATALFTLQLHSQTASLVLDDEMRMRIAKLVQHAENDFVGVNSGLLDPFTSLFGAEGHAVTLDCRSLEYARLPLGKTPPAIVVCDSGTSRKLADGMYNKRRSECDGVVESFRNLGLRSERRIGSLRDLKSEDLDAAWSSLDPVGRKRARHVVTENARVEAGRWRFGKAMSSTSAA